MPPRRLRDLVDVGLFAADALRPFRDDDDVELRPLGLPVADGIDDLLGVVRASPGRG